MTTSLYPETRTEKDVLRNMQEIARIRETEDVSDFQNLNNRFVLGRARGVTRAAPSSNSDVLSTDEVGDYVNDGTYEYKLLNISGTLKWDRRTLSVAW
ncbi:hypothetical protein UFOVP1454_56 [uncultured Caudovirales phage]|uniref:Uncharacterized protein n=1 Tax=uncultured Caudovirales phage TaxID=2100421 RepID=A0A6J5SK38_9CAUD|nr:hypothetical protein UFOVP1454_56 [uncultured Caudovirales phage]